MNKAKFWVDHCFEAGDAGICEHYWFEVELSDEEFEELYQVWYDNGGDLDSWYSNWEGHRTLYDKLDAIAYHSLNDLLKKHEPEFADPIQVLWQISQDTADAF